MLKDKIVFITGASSGIGAACARFFAQEGAKLLLCSRNLVDLKPVATALQADFGVDVYPFTMDVRQQAVVRDTLQDLPSAWQSVDVLINNAGLAVGLDKIQEGDPTDWDAMIDTNVKGLLYVTRAILPQMLAKNAGHIINIGSIAGHAIYPGGAVYCATKHAVNTLTQGLRMDVFNSQVRVSTVDPGACVTNFSKVRFKGDDARAAAVYQNMTPLTAEDVADAVLYCAKRPPHVNIDEIIIMPTDQASISMIARHEKS